MKQFATIELPAVMSHATNHDGPMTQSQRSRYLARTIINELVLAAQIGADPVDSVAEILRPHLD